jgi:DNA polymerase III delta prime subunit
MNNVDTINDTLNKFIERNNVPNILFHGNNSIIKENIVTNFLMKLYPNYNDYKQYTMIVNCAHGKGIKFVREDIKFFSKTNIKKENGLFKSIVLINAEKLTVDAQSALRRCIEIFSHSTRFFLIVNNKENLLKPIISRLCDLYIYHNNNNAFFNELFKFEEIYNKTIKIINNEFNKFSNEKCNLFNLSEKLYNKGVTANHIILFIYNKKYKKQTNNDNLLSIMFNFFRIKNSIRDEKILITIILDLYFFRCTYNLENIDFL